MYEVTRGLVELSEPPKENDNLSMVLYDWWHKWFAYFYETGNMILISWHSLGHANQKWPFLSLAV